MDKKTWIIFGVIVAAFVALIVFFNMSNKSNQIDVSGLDLAKVLAASTQSGQIGDHVQGKQDSKVVFIEYGDYQCNACAYAFPRISAISEEYKDQVAFVFRNYPIPSLHPNALTAATVAEAAGLQNNDMFWKMHDALYSSQSAWISSSIDSRLTDMYNLAASVGINKQQLVNNIKSEAINKRLNQKINFDMATGKKLNIQGTPSFFINGKEIGSDTWGDDEKLKKLLDDTLKKHNIAPPKHD